MKTGKKLKSKPASIENVKRFFSNTPDSDSVSVDDAFVSWGRNLEKKKANMAWLSNVLFHLKYHNLIKPVYDYGSGRKKLDAIQLTFEGKRALGRIEGNSDEDFTSSTPTNSHSNSKTITDVMKIVAKLRQDNPEYDVTFDVKLKGI